MADSRASSGPDQPRAPADRAHSAPTDDEQSDSSRSAGGLDPSAAWNAAQDFLQAARDFAAALGGLLRSELRLARAAWPWVIALLIILVGLSVSLWLSVIALAGWGLYVLTGSVGWALVGLVVAHVVLLLLAYFGFKRRVHHMTLPETRSEVHDLLNRASRS